MCSRGILQLKRLNLVYSDWGGSSVNFKEYLMSEFFDGFRKRFPSVDCNFLMKRQSHPYVTGFYINGYIKDIPLRNKMLPEIAADFEFLVSSCLVKSRTRCD